MKTNPQRYRLIHEFELRDRADYPIVAQLFRRTLQELEEKLASRIQGDYFAIEKCEAPDGK